MKLISKYSMVPAACFLALLISSCNSYERITDSKEAVSNYTQESNHTQEPGSKAEAAAQETEQTESERETEKEIRKNEGNSAGDTDISARAKAVCGNYFKAGDYRYQLNVTPGEPDARGILKMEFSQRDEKFSNSFRTIREFNLRLEEDVNSYSLEDVSVNGDGSAFTVGVNKDGSITLQGSTDEAGDYYECENSLIMAEAFRRPLNDTDLIGLDLEDMQLLRNQFYAVHGRIFKNEKLKSYFGKEPWYQANTESDKFDEKIFTGLEKRNIAFLKAAEENFDEKKAAELKAAIDALAPAPYLELLPKEGEISVSMYSDFEHAADRGIYYEAEGTISVPITITIEQQKEIEAGGSVELVVDELTGKTSVLKKSGKPDYGTYVFVDTPDGNEDYGDYVMAAYEPGSGIYRLWSDSDDTRFKRIYEGPIYVLKGACEEYFYYFDMPEKDRGEAEGSYRMMNFNEVNPYGPTPYNGNLLVTDPKGYVKALYFRGD